MDIFVRTLFFILAFQNCTPSKTKIGNDFVCQDNIDCCERHQENRICLATFTFITPKNSFKVNEKLYYQYSIGSDRNYSTSFYCIENQFKEIVYYRGTTHYCSFYKNNEEGKQIKKYVVSQLSPIEIIKEEDVEKLEGEIRIE